MRIPESWRGIRPEDPLPLSLIAAAFAVAIVLFVTAAFVASML